MFNANKKLNKLIEIIKGNDVCTNVSKSLPDDELEYMKGVISELIKMHEHPELSNEDWKKAVIDVAKEKGYGNDC